jgi:cystathionine beta-lyase/cystathionine gamma-synthase
MHRDTRMHPDTTAIHADRDLNDSESVAPLIWQTSTYSGDSAEEFLEMATRPMHDRFYARYGNPTLSQAQAVISSLEGTEGALLTASGMAAISTTVLALVKSGDHVVGQLNH